MKVLTDDEVKVLKSARKILQTLTKKHKKLDKQAYESGDETKLNEFEEAVYKQAKVDFLTSAFIDVK